MPEKRKFNAPPLIAIEKHCSRAPQASISSLRTIPKGKTQKKGQIVRKRVPRRQQRLLTHHELVRVLVGEKWGEVAGELPERVGVRAMCRRQSARIKQDTVNYSRGRSQQRNFSLTASF